MAEPPEDIPTLPSLDGLPHWVQWTAYAVIGIATGILIFVGRFGWMMARRGEPPSKGAEIAAVIVDPKALNRASDAVLQLEATLARATDLLGQFIAESREERREQELEDAREQGRAEARAERRSPRQRRTPRPSKAV